MECVKREVARLKPMEISQHLMLGMIAIEHLVREEGSSSGQGLPGNWSGRCDSDPES